MSIPYDYYRIFYYVARYQSLTRAAHALQSNQPNVTRTINALERELGCRLFQRSHRGVTLTPEGEKLFAHVQIMQEQLQAAEYELAGSRSLQSGSVSIGASETALHGLLLPVLRRFRQQHPGVRFQITNHSSPQAVAALRAGLVELAVVCTPCDEISKPLAEIPLRPTQDVLVAGPEYADLAARPLTLQEVADLPLVCLGPGSSTYTFFGQLFAQQGLTLSPDIQAATADQILPMVRYGLGLGFVPMELARGPLEKGEVIQLSLDQPIPARWISLVKDKSRPLSVAALELEKTLRAAAREG
ncbi:MAG TPA: LysR family transcriptional regulator [Candidatus Faecalibacterium intestinipullorum]|uniref:LysR family transcriptional regulator n=2 Tax=Faecalibacterium gallinarum TaxID=2903556 RepID=A0AA37IX49_9FIRM|nr:LysR family transcriptional regulator [Faecalibacterium gallinarum]HIV51231.1 LysR family transcriptional regulator [Candidatus Faecalibacterium intestinipullorum]